MIGLTAQQRRCLLVIQSFMDENGYSPSIDGIASIMGLRAKSSAFYILNGLEERGYVRRLPNRARSIEILKRIDAPEHPAPTINGRPAMFIPVSALPRPNFQTFHPDGVANV